MVTTVVVIDLEDSKMLDRDLCHLLLELRYSLQSGFSFYRQDSDMPPRRLSLLAFLDLAAVSEAPLHFNQDAGDHQILFWINPNWVRPRSRQTV